MQHCRHQHHGHHRIPIFRLEICIHSRQIPIQYILGQLLNPQQLVGIAIRQRRLEPQTGFHHSWDLSAPTYLLHWVRSQVIRTMTVRPEIMRRHLKRMQRTRLRMTCQLDQHQQIRPMKWITCLQCSHLARRNKAILWINLQRRCQWVQQIKNIVTTIITIMKTTARIIYHI